MLKIAIFDSGYGGEEFADRLESELPTTEIIRVIDWRSAEKVLGNPKEARFIAEKALSPYIGKVDLIVIANYLISVTSLRYFRRKYKNQKFVGFTLRPRRIIPDRPTLILTTKAVTRSLAYISFICRFNTRTICLDSWPALIDDGELTKERLIADLSSATAKIKNFTPKQILLACGQFSELKSEIHAFFGHNVRVVDSFEDTIKAAHRTLGLRGRSFGK